jgi:hypothetical protein
VGGFRAGQPIPRPGTTRNWPRPDPNLPNSNLDADEDDEPPPPPAAVIQPRIAPPPPVNLGTPPPGTYYQPGLQSSGRLEIKLLGRGGTAVRAGG